MAIYWVLLVFPVIGQFVHSNLSPQTNRIAWASLIFVWVIVIGFRHTVGCDWEPYAGFYQSSIHLLEFRDEYLALNSFWPTIVDSIAFWEPSYAALNLFAALTGTGIYGVNLICGLLIVFGLSAFCRQMPLQWLAWITATPYFLTVISLGYTRQGTAIGLILWAFASLKQKKIWLYLLFCLLAVSFHKWSVLIAFIGLPLLFPKRYQLQATTLTFLAILVLGTFAYFIKVGFNPLHFQTFYLDQQSIGSGLRICLTAFTATIFLLVWRKNKEMFDNPGVWVAISCFSIVCLILPFFGLTATVVDRFTLYLSPLQFYFWSHFPLCFSNNVERKLAIGLVIITYSSIMMIWFNFANHAHCWMPYQNILFPG